MIPANGGLPAHRYTPQVTQRWPRGSEPASIGERDYNESTYIPFASESGQRRRPTDASVKGIHGEPGIAETERYEGEDGDEHPATT